MKKINIAIDGFASCGKSTLAKAIASYFHYKYVDTGSMYRALALHAIRSGWLNDDNTINATKLEKNIGDIEVDFDYNPDTKKSEVFLNNEPVENFIRTIEIGNYASAISQLRFVRNKLQKLQKKIASKRGVVMDGRDIGTVIMPDAELKIFMTANPTVRGERRLLELKEKGIESTLEDVIEAQAIRDFDDLTRKEDPLKQADDAIIIDNSNMTEEQQFQYVIELVNNTRHSYS